MIKKMTSTDYNWVFDTDTGFFARWGQTKQDDPQLSPIGPEILDIEVSTICHGPGKPCKWCYKSNTSVGKNMSLDTFKNILDKISETRNLMQIAFGIGDIDSNPDLYAMFEYSRSKKIVPNVTINGWRMNSEHFDKLASLCGAVAVSHYDNEHCADAVKALTDRGMDQVNIHKLLSNETLEECYRLIDFVKTDSRMEKLNAIVFLLLKPKGKRNTLTAITSLEAYRDLFKYALNKGVQFGMDSCSGPNLLKATEGLGLFDPISVEPCESTLFSLYINVDGDVFPCSFTEGQPGWEQGISVVDKEDFMDVWYDIRLRQWRDKLLASSTACLTCQFRAGCRSCPEFDITICK